MRLVFEHLIVGSGTHFCPKLENQWFVILSDANMEIPPAVTTFTQFYFALQINLALVFATYFTFNFDVTVNVI